MKGYKYRDGYAQQQIYKQGEFHSKRDLEYASGKIRPTRFATIRGKTRAKEKYDSLEH